MEFKIDTKPSYTIIIPITGAINANLTEALHKKGVELRQSGSSNYIVDLHNCLEVDNTSLPDLVKLHEECYGESQSLVFTNLQDNVMEAIKNEGIDTLVNIAPTMDEAIDIISMEILERDLFNEES